MTKEELEREIKRLEKELAITDHDREHNYYECLDLYKKVAELEKENAELKGIKDVATLIRANNDTVTTLMQLNNMLVSKNQQLTKAKEIIKELMSFSVQLCDCRHTVDFEKTREEAVQFLKDSEVEK